MIIRGQISMRKHWSICPERRYGIGKAMERHDGCLAECD